MDWYERRLQKLLGEGLTQEEAVAQIDRERLPGITEIPGMLARGAGRVARGVRKVADYLPTVGTPYDHARTFENVTEGVSRALGSRSPTSGRYQLGTLPLGARETGTQMLEGAENLGVPLPEGLVSGVRARTDSLYEANPPQTTGGMVGDMAAAVSPYFLPGVAAGASGLPAMTAGGLGIAGDVAMDYLTGASAPENSLVGMAAGVDPADEGVKGKLRGVADWVTQNTVGMSVDEAAADPFTRGAVDAATFAVPGAGIMGLARAAPPLTRAARYMRGQAAGDAGHGVNPAARSIESPSTVPGEVETGMGGRWYSQLQRSVDEFPQDVATAEQWAKGLQRADSRAERDWAGLDEFLKERAGQTISRDEMREFAESNAIGLSETLRGDLPAAKDKQARLDEFTAVQGRARREIGDVVGMIGTEADQYYLTPLRRGDSSVDDVLREISADPDVNAEALRPVLEEYAESATRWDEFRSPADDTQSPFSANVVPGETDGYKEVRIQWTGSDHVASAGHRDPPGEIARLRMTTREVNGEKTTFIDEIQSDWHQKGREQGYRQEPIPKYAIFDRSGEVVGRFDDLDEARAAVPDGGTGPWALPESRGQMGVPDAPFKKTDEWVGLAVRRALQEAVDSGSDRVAWASGDQAANLYDLRQQVSRIEWDEAGGSVRAYDHSNEVVISQKASPEELPGIIGKGPAERVLSADVDEVTGARFIEGDDLAVGGEGMKTFYDQIVAKAFAKEAKKLGLEIEPVRVSDDARASFLADDDLTMELNGPGDTYRIRQSGVIVGTGRSQKDALEAAAKNLGRTFPTEPTNLSVRITPKARDQILNQGQRIGAVDPATARGAGSLVARGLVGAGVGANVSEEPGQGAAAGMLAGVFGPHVAGEALKGLRGMGDAGHLVNPASPAVTQEAISTGRHAFMPALGDAPPEMKERFTREVRAAMTAPDGRDVTAAAVERLVGRQLDVEVIEGRGAWGGAVNPNEIVVLKGASDEEVRTYMAVNGVVRGQDAQGAVRVLPEGEEGARGYVIGSAGADEVGAMAPDEMDRVLKELGDAGYGATAVDGEGVIIVVDFDGVGDPLASFVGRLADDGLGVEPHGFASHYMEGTRAYLEAVGQNAEEVGGLADLLSQQIRPVYQRFADELGLGEEAFAGLDARVEEIRAYQRELANPNPRGNRKGVSVVEAQPQIASRWRKVTSTKPRQVTKTLTARAREMIDAFVEGVHVLPEQAREWYAGGALGNRRIAQLAIPELRDDRQYTLYTLASSIASNGQQVPDEVRAGLNVFEQYQRAGKFSLLDQGEPTRYATYQIPTEKGSRAQRALEGTRAPGLPTASGARERVRGTPRSYLHETHYDALNRLIDDLGPEGAADFLTGTVSRRKGGVVIDVPVMEEIFGPKIGRYALDKLGLHPEAGDATIDLWMARAYYALMGLEQPTRKTKKGRVVLDDTVTPEIRRVMNDVMRELVKGTDSPVSTAQAELWYGIKWAFREAGAKEKSQAYATLPSAAADVMSGAKTTDPGTIRQGIPDEFDSVEEAWDPTNALSRLRTRPEYREARKAAERGHALPAQIRGMGSLASGAVGASVDEDNRLRGFVAGAAAPYVVPAAIRHIAKLDDAGHLVTPSKGSKKSLELGSWWSEATGRPLSDWTTMTKFEQDLQVKQLARAERDLSMGGSGTVIGNATRPTPPGGRTDALPGFSVEGTTVRDSGSGQFSPKARVLSGDAPEVGKTNTAAITSADQLIRRAFGDRLFRPGIPEAHYKGKYTEDMVVNTPDEGYSFVRYIGDGDPTEGLPDMVVLRESDQQPLVAYHEGSGLSAWFNPNSGRPGRSDGWWIGVDDLARNTGDPDQVRLLDEVRRLQEFMAEEGDELLSPGAARMLSPGDDPRAGFDAGGIAAGTGRALAGGTLGAATADERDEKIARFALGAALGARGRHALKDAATARRALMLYNPATHVVNFGGNAAQLGLETAQSPIAAAFDRLFLSRITGERATFANSPADIAEALRRARTEGATDAGRVLKEGQSADELRKLDLDDSPQGMVITAITEPVFRMLSAGDRVFWNAAMGKSISEQARVMASRVPDASEMGGVDAIADYYRRKPTDEMQIIAAMEAAESVYQDKGKLRDAVKSMRSGMVALGGEQGAAVFDLLVPYQSTPSNIVTRALQFSPVGYAQAAVDVVALRRFVEQGQDALKEGTTLADRAGGLRGIAEGADLTNATTQSRALQRRAGQAVGRATIGSGIMALGYIAHQNGWWTGEYPEDAQSRNEMSLTGETTSSIVTSEGYLSLDRLGPIAIILNAGAEMAKAEARGELTEDGNINAMAAVGKFANVAADAVSNSPFGDAEAARSLFTQGRGLNRAAADIVGSAVPAPIGTFARNSDVVRERRPGSMVDAVRYNLPGLRKGLPARVDALGRTVGDGTTLRGFERIVNPFPYRKKDDDPLVQEIARVGASIPDARAVGGIRGAGIERGTPEYESLMRRYGEEVRAELQKTIDTGRAVDGRWVAYEDATDEQKKRMLQAAASSAKSRITGELKDERGG